VLDGRKDVRLRKKQASLIENEFTAGGDQQGVYHKLIQDKESPVDNGQQALSKRTFFHFFQTVLTL